MQVGFNYPWYSNRYGHWMGPFPHVNATDTSHLTPIWISSLPANLAQLARMKVQVVRMFIMGDCFNYGPAPFKLSGTPGLPSFPFLWRFNQPEYLDDPAYTHDPDGKSRRFSDHYIRLLQTFKNAGLKLIPSIIDFPAFLNPPSIRTNLTGIGGSLIAGGRADIVEDLDKRRKFFEHVLQGFIDISLSNEKKYKDVIYAIEIMNEPTWNIRTIKPGPAIDNVGNRIISESTMGEFLAQACKRIEDAGFESTVGHRFYKDCLQLPTGTLAQFHYYPPPDYIQEAADITIGRIQQELGIGHPLQVPSRVTEGEHAIENVLYSPDPLVIPDHDQALRDIQAMQLKVRPGWTRSVRDVFIGEFGTSIDGKTWPELQKRDQDPTVIVEGRLLHLFKKGYPLALMWPHKTDTSGKDDSLITKMDQDRWSGVARFTGR